ncbi:hypothetical protein IG631_19078 [Alternaria alternata]|nr:hypothetical protein IG631_19078 [Alternaria alternata]
MSSSSSAVDPALASRPQQEVGPLRPYVQTSEGLQGSGPPCDQQQGLYASFSSNDASNTHRESDPVWAAVNAQRLGPTLTIRGNWRQDEKSGGEAELHRLAALVVTSSNAANTVSLQFLGLLDFCITSDGTQGCENA